MIRLAWMVIVLAAVAAGSVHLRLQRNGVQAQVQRLEAQRLSVRRTLWDQQIRLGELSAPPQARRRGPDGSAEATPPGPPPPSQRTAQRSRQ